MRNYFKYEFKKNLPFIIIVSVIFITILAIYLFNADFVYSRYEYINGEPTGNMIDVARNSPIGMITTFAYILVFIVPIKNYSFKMKKIAVDVYYQLPIKKKSQYLTKYLVGLLEIIIPFVLSVFISLLIILCREHIFKLQYLLLYIIALIPYIVILYTIVIFAYIKGNTLKDGVLNICMYILATLLIACVISLFYDSFSTHGYCDMTSLTMVSPMSCMSTIISYYLKGLQQITIETEFIISLIMYIPVGIGFFILFLYNEDKAEDCAQISNSWFSYKVLLPLICALSALLFSYVDTLYVNVFVAIAGYIGYVIYRRTFKITKNDMIALSSSIIAGAIIGLVIHPFI